MCDLDTGALQDTIESLVMLFPNAFIESHQTSKILLILFTHA